jgi:hypothetical protein
VRSRSSFTNAADIYLTLLTSQDHLVVFDKNEAQIKKSRAERGDLLLTLRHLTLQDLP